MIQELKSIDFVVIETFIEASYKSLINFLWNRTSPKIILNN
ncbi:hypothetical protein CMALT394_630018 [Carnobacterium maltaromaticum]|nr:hypothetical protein CMALT394_630018 [Carnobacterium maltaromaticum]